jgi:hypothetical protein
MSLFPLQSCAVWWPTCANQTLSVPNLDALVGTVATFNVSTNWCSLLAVPNYNPAQDGYNLGPYYGSTNTPDPYVGVGLFCTYDQTNVSTSSYSTASSDRALASTNSFVTHTHVKVHVGASFFDCHVPKVKGVTLRKAKARLGSHHCGSPYVRYIKGKGNATGVRYQPLPVGTGRPKGYRVSLAVARPTHT